jgi:Leucine-rich repeat (LRR) protein
MGHFARSHSAACIISMTPLINCLSALPANVAGTHVFAFLSLPSLGRLDAAVGHKEQRRLIMEAFSFVTTAVPHPHDDAQDVQHEKRIWRWCMARGVTLTEIQIAGVEGSQELNQLQRVLLLVPQHGVVRYLCDLSVAMEDSTNFLLSNDVVRSRITSLSLSMNRAGNIPSWKWGSVQNVKILSVTGDILSEQALAQLLLGISALERVELCEISLLSSDTVQALCGHGATLSHMQLQNANCHAEVLGWIGQHCRNLKELSVMSNNPETKYPLWTNEQGWVAVAQGCRKLTHISVWYGAGLTESALLALAAHCPDLADLSLYTCNFTVTDTVLLAVTKGCPNLRNVRSDEWAVQSITTVDAAESLLTRLESCAFLSSTAVPPAVLARTVSYLRNVTNLSLHGLSVAQLKALRGITSFAANNCEILVLSGCGNQSVAMDDFVVAVVGGSTQLHTIDLRRGSYISQSALVQVAGLCATIRRVICVDCVLDDTSESALLAMARRWPGLLELFLGQNLAYTDAVLKAMAERCPYLQSVNLLRNKSVAVDALLRAVESLPNCRFVVPRRFSSAERGRITEAVARARAINGPG